MFCSIANIVSHLDSIRNPSTFLLFLRIFGGTEILVVLGSRILVHQKEAAENKPEASFRISSGISIPQFRSYGRIEDPRPVGRARSLVQNNVHRLPEESRRALHVAGQ